MKHLIVLVGNIASGKTTLAKEYVDKGYVCITRDGLRYSIGCGNYIFNLKYEPVVFKTELFLLEEFMKLGINIIIDEVGINNSHRARYLALATYYKYKTTAMILPEITKEEALRRRAKQNTHGNQSTKVWDKVWDKFNAAYHRPSKEEGFDRVVYVKGNK